LRRRKTLLSPSHKLLILRALSLYNKRKSLKVEKQEKPNQKKSFYMGRIYLEKIDKEV
jgi:hypothetical protein